MRLTLIIEEGLEAIEGFLLQTMQDRDESQIKTAAGVAFRSPQVRVKMVDRDAFLDFCVANRDFSMITNHVSKDAVRDYMARGSNPTNENGYFTPQPQPAPPGVEITEFITCNVRKA